MTNGMQFLLAQLECVDTVLFHSSVVYYSSSDYIYIYIVCSQSDESCLHHQEVEVSCPNKRVEFSSMRKRKFSLNIIFLPTHDLFSRQKCEMTGFNKSNKIAEREKNI